MQRKAKKDDSGHAGQRDCRLSLRGHAAAKRFAAGFSGIPVGRLLLQHQHQPGRQRSGEHRAEPGGRDRIREIGDNFKGVRLKKLTWLQVNFFNLTP